MFLLITSILIEIILLLLSRLPTSNIACSLHIWYFQIINCKFATITKYLQTFLSTDPVIQVKFDNYFYSVLSLLD